MSVSFILSSLHVINFFKVSSDWTHTDFSSCWIQSQREDTDSCKSISCKFIWKSLELWKYEKKKHILEQLTT